MPTLPKMAMDRQKQINYCAFCPKLCRFVCPVALHSRRETDTPAGKYALLYLQEKGTIDFDCELASVMYQCTQCNAGRWACDHKINNESGIWEARRDAVAKGVEPEQVRAIRDRYKKFGSAHGKDLGTELLGLVPKDYLDRDSSLLYFPSCTTIADRPENVKDTVKILSALFDRDFAVGGGAGQCCGYLLYTLGYEEDFVELGKTLSGELSKYNKIVSGDPACVYTLKHLYPKYGMALEAEILHTSELFFQHLDGLVALAGGKDDGSAHFYHDPCYLGRFLGVYEQPRQLLKIFGGGVLMEFSRRLEHTECCGGGGGFPVVSPGLASLIAKSRLSEPKEHDPVSLVTSCPTCEVMFSRSCPEAQVKDLVNVIAKRI